MKDTSVANDSNVMTTKISSSADASTVVVLLSCAAITMQMLRISIDMIQVASNSDDTKKKATTRTNEDDKKTKKNYGSVSDTAGASKNGTPSTTTTDEERQGLLSKPNKDVKEEPAEAPATFSSKALPRISLLCHVLLAILFGVVPWSVAAAANHASSLFPRSLNESTVFVLLLGAFVNVHDGRRSRFGFFQRFFYVLAMASVVASYFGLVFSEFYNGSRQGPASALLLSRTDQILVGAVAFFVGLTLVDVCVTNGTLAPPNATAKAKRSLSRKALLTMLKPYFWPDATDSSALWNRARAIMTWVCVIMSKVCGLVSPLLLGWASTALAHQDYTACVQWSILYAFLQFLSSTFKEGQSLIYLKVAQAAFVQLSETTFAHVHQLSLDWHLRKKLGEVIRSMDRGIAACDTLMKYLFLWMLPALVECVVVCAIFASYFQYLPLGISVFFFVFVYIVWTILVTLWRKKFRKAVVKSDNEWHDRCTDSLINFETVKFFTAEDYEMKRFGDAVRAYQRGSVNVQASLSFLNISQRAIMQACLATSLALSAYGIKQRSDCCIQEMECESVFSDCCQATTNAECPGMEVGDFVAVLTYTLNLFQPLNFLGSVYNAIVMAIIDLANLSELLAENPDVTDAPNAKPIPATNEEDPDVVVEFDNVVFHYPTQPSNKGLKGLSFKMKKGTTTAIVGPTGTHHFACLLFVSYCGGSTDPVSFSSCTGAGKTTVSRLLFRFYDALGGAVRVNGVDVRSMTQTSLRSAIGVVPQAASMFNDTIRYNLLYGKREATQEELDQAVKDAQLLEFIESLDDGWETMVGDRGLKLSGGEKQRAASK